MMAGEVIAGIGAIKTAFDIAKALKDIDDAARRNSAVIDLQQQILTAQEAQTALLERVDELKKEMVQFEKWETEQQRYELVRVGTCAFAYMLKKDARGSKPPHWICTKCFGDRHKEVIQKFRTPAGIKFQCPRCKAVYDPDEWAPKWLDS